MRKFLTFFFLSVIGLALLAGILSSLNNFVKVSDLKKLAESRMGDLLHARVRVNEVKVGFLDHISLRGLEINQEVKDKVFYLLDIDKIVFKYNLDRFWGRHFDRPNIVYLDSPRFIFKSVAIPFALLHLDELIKDGGVLTDVLHFNDGRVSVNLRDEAYRLDFTGIQGEVRKTEGGLWHVDLQGQISNLFKGTIAAAGKVDLRNKEASVRLTLNGLDSVRPEELPVSELRGAVELTKDELRFENVSFVYSRIPVVINGTVRGYETPAPVLDLSIKLGTKDFGTRVAVQGALDGSELTGKLEIAKMSVPVGGKVQVGDHAVILNELTIGRFARSQAEFDYSEEVCRFYLENENQRIDWTVNLKNWELDIQYEGDHVPFFGADMVCKTRFQMQPDEALWKNKQWAFDGIVQTDLLVLDRTPFPDLAGTFHTTAAEVDRISLRWGKGYSLEGKMSLYPPFPVESRVSLRDINLRQMTALFSHPLPAAMRGVASGDLQIRGEGQKTEMNGTVTVEAGSISGFDYDEVILRFFGIPPYLKLNDSVLKKGMRTFYLEGTVDLTKENIFQDIRATSAERIVVWDGQALSRKAGQEAAVGVGQ